MKRLRALDVFRGLVVAAMVLVNSPGSDEIYSPFRHAVWHGWTPTDLIFPFFLVIMGVSAAFSQAPLQKVLIRAAMLIGFGLLENEFIYRGTAGVRFPGVLQRIALCYLGVEAFLFYKRPRSEPWAAALLVLVYWGLLMYVPVPGHGAGVLTPEGNLSYWLDRRLFAGHLMKDRWGDPEGLLATMSALATSLIGLIAGRRLVAQGASAARSLAVWGASLAVIGAGWSLVLPFNKHIWTSSYSLFTAGLALATLSACLRAVEGRKAAWAGPFEAVGRRALAVYLAAGFFYGIQESVPMILPDGTAGNLKLWLTARLFPVWISAKGASLLYALGYTAATVAAVTAYASRARPTRP